MFSTAKLLIWPEEKASENAERSHQVDSLNLLIFVCLLILTILTVWLFKRVRIRFVHETGLSIIYGLIVGAIIKYSSSRLFPHPSMPQVESTAKFNNVTTPQTSPNHLIASSVATFMNITEPPDQVKDITVTPAIFPEEVRHIDLDEKATFDPEVFFNVLLPPIIFHAGYSMKKKHFFKNFGTIALFAFVGTLVSSFVTGVIMFLFMYLTGAFWSFGDCLKFGSLISATDPVSVLTIFNDLNVDVDLYALVFGESVLNDAVAIVLVSTVNMYKSDKSGFDGLAVVRSVGNFIIVFFGAFALGIAMGFVTALMTKFTHIKDHPLLESSLFVLMSYCTFLAAEAAQMTGIVALLFCGICQAHYTYSNMSTESKARTKQVFELLNFLAENFVFVYIGVSTFTFKKHIWNIPFIFMAFFAIIIARALNIYPLSLLLNIGRTPKIPANFQHFMMFSGLRGAMAFALSIRGTSTKEECTIFTTTLVIVMSTIVLSGGFTTQMLSWLKIKVGLPERGETQGFETLHSSPQRYVMDQSSSRSLINRYGFFRLWYMFDSRFLKPLLTHSRPPLTDTLPKCCLPLALLLTTEQQKQQIGLVDGLKDDEDSDYDFMASTVGNDINLEEALFSNSVFNTLHNNQNINNSSSINNDASNTTSNIVNSTSPLKYTFEGNNNSNKDNYSLQAGNSITNIHDLYNNNNNISLDSCNNYNNNNNNDVFYENEDNDYVTNAKADVLDPIKQMINQSMISVQVKMPGAKGDPV